jgi:hypothetical protein
MSIIIFNKNQIYQKGETIRPNQMLPNYKNHLKILHEANSLKILPFSDPRSLRQGEKNERKRCFIFPR